MLSITYEGQRKRREELLRRLFLMLANETIEEELGNIEQSPTLEIEWAQRGASSCDNNTLQISLNLECIKRLAHNGYSNSYYEGRRVRIGKHTLHNRHNKTRFQLYHELKHFCDRIKYNKNPYLTFGKKEAEYRADSFALSKLKEMLK